MEKNSLSKSIREEKFLFQQGAPLVVKALHPTVKDQLGEILIIGSHLATRPMETVERNQTGNRKAYLCKLRQPVDNVMVWDFRYQTQWIYVNIENRMYRGTID